MPDSDPVGKAVREQRRRERLGENPVCVLCDVDDPRALVPADPRLIEEDHVFGRQRDPDTTVPLCRNHHAILTEERRDAGISMQSGPNPLEETAQKHRSLGLFFRRLGNALCEDAEAIWDAVERLDRDCPEWRDVLEEDSTTDEG